MNAFRIFVLSLLTVISFSCFAGPNDPLFVSLTTDEPHRARMALSFGKHHFDNVFIIYEMFLLELNLVPANMLSNKPS